jgi:hypothetical protein
VIGPVEILVFLLAGAVLVLLVVVLSPPVGMSHAFFVGAILDVFAPM